MVELKKKGNKGDFGDFETRKNIVPRLKPNNLCIKQLYNLKVISGVQVNIRFDRSAHSIYSFESRKIYEG